MKLRTVIIDDEPDAVSMITAISNDYCPKIEIVGTAASAKKGISLIKEHNPDLIFLDVEMPQGSGFDVLSHFQDKTFDVIFVTAFNDYALKAIKFSAVDYILKPININEFIQAVEKVFEKRESSRNNSIHLNVLLENIRTPWPIKLAVPTSEGFEYINTQEIIRIEAEGSYSRFYLVDDRKYFISRNLKVYQELLQENNFFRTHNSHLVNLYRVKKYIRQEDGLIEMEDGSIIPISRGKRELFLAQMTRIAK